jgi:hypothetical protein
MYGLLRGSPLVRFAPPPEGSAGVALALASPARPVAARRRAEATAGFPTAGAWDAVTVYSCEHLHNNVRVAQFLSWSEHVQRCWPT